MKFRSLPKKSLQVQVPEGVIAKIGHKAVQEGRPDNEVVTRLLCVGLGIDPSTYGIQSPPKNVSVRSKACAN